METGRKILFTAEIQGEDTLAVIVTGPSGEYTVVGEVWKEAGGWGYKAFGNIPIPISGLASNQEGARVAVLLRHKLHTYRALWYSGSGARCSAFQVQAVSLPYARLAISKKLRSFPSYHKVWDAGGCLCERWDRKLQKWVVDPS